MKLYRVCLLVTLLGLVCSCSLENRRLQSALELAGDNRGELEKVLEYYKDSPLKLEAARFLIQNMSYHFGFHDRLLAPDKEEFTMDISACVSEEDISLTFDSLLKRGYTFQRENIKDIDTVSAAFLIDSIELAFEVWGRKWARGVSFDTFCRYILPYRVGNEPISGLRRSMKERYLSLLDSMEVSTPLEACNALNVYLKDKIRSRSISPFYTSVEYVERFRQSNCEGITVYVVFLMRAVGIPVAMDQTIWSKTDHGHCWSSLVDTVGKSHAFDPGFRSTTEFIRDFSNALLPAKVYRREYGLQEVALEVTDDGYRTFLKNPFSKDVTTEYWAPVVDIHVELGKQCKPAEAPVYLCVYNAGQWTELSLGERVGKKCVVRNVVGDNIFRMADCVDRQSLHFLTPPFYVDSIGQVSFFKSPVGGKVPLTFYKNKLHLTKPHTVSYWDDSSSSFKMMEIVHETDSSVSCNAPQAALFVLRAESMPRQLYVVRNGTLCRY